MVNDKDTLFKQTQSTTSCRSPDCTELDSSGECRLDLDIAIRKKGECEGTAALEWEGETYD